MRKLDLRPIRGVNGEDYPLHEVLKMLITHPNRQLNGPELLKAQEVAEKIAQAEGDHILLEEAEWEHLRDGVEKVRGFGTNDVELVRRILRAPQVKVKEAKE